VGGGKPNQALARAIFCTTLRESREVLFDSANNLLLFDEPSGMRNRLLMAIMDRERSDTNLDYVIRVLKGDVGNISPDVVAEIVMNEQCPSLRDVITKSTDEMRTSMMCVGALPPSVLLAKERDEAGDEDLFVKYKGNVQEARAILRRSEEQKFYERDAMGFNDYAMQQPSCSASEDESETPGTPIRYVLFDASSSSSDEEEEEEEEEEEKEKEEEEEKEEVCKGLPWTHSHIAGPETLSSLKDYSWFVTVWYRVNVSQRLVASYKRVCGRNKLLDYKVRRFVQQEHLAAVQYLDSFEDPRDANIDPEALNACYKGMGNSHFHDDRNLVRTTFTRHKVKKTPLEIIRERYPGMTWTADDAAHAIKKGVILVGGDSPSAMCPRIDGEWAPLPNAPVATHTLYYGCIFVLNQCQRLLDTHREDSFDNPIFDALWAYYVAFADVFYFCLATHPKHKPVARMDDMYLLTPLDGYTEMDGTLVIGDRATPWELYGQCMDTRAFHAGDLPDLFHVLFHIPLWGEQNTPPSLIGRLLQKSLPFACQRRRLIKLIVTNIAKEPGFWVVFAKLYWVMLSGLYPGELGPRENKLGMRELLRAKELTDPVHGKAKLVAALEAKDDLNAGSGGAANGGPLVVFTSFRLLILYMGSLNPHYVEAASKCVDWELFKSDVIHMTFLIRGHNLFPEDPFAQARKQLSRTIKNPNSRVHRLRRRSAAVTLKDHCNKVLEKHVLRDFQQRRSDLKRLLEIRGLVPKCDTEPQQDVCLRGFKTTGPGRHCAGGNVAWSAFPALLDRAISVTKHGVDFYRGLFSVGVKSAILNILVRLPPADRLSLHAFSILMLPAYGAISHQSVAIMMELLNVYHEKAVPKEFARCIDAFALPDFMIVCFYFNSVAMLDQYRLVPLDAETVRRTDQAMMTVRHKLYPGQQLPSSAYEVTVAFCCGNVRNLMGFGKYGDKKIAFDIERRGFVCTHGRSTKGTSSEEEEEEDVRSDLKHIMNPTVVRINAMRTSGGTRGFVSKASAEKGRGTKRTKQMKDRKELRNQRKQFSAIPCGQPVCTINLRGRALVYGNTLEKQERIMFCPECGALHMYNMLNYVGSEIGDGLYRCNECALKEMAALTPFLACAYCQKSTPGQVTEKTRLNVLCPVNDPTNPDFDPIVNGGDVLQWLYFCRGHYSIARRYAWGMPKNMLWKKIARVQQQKNKEIAMGKYTQKKPY